MTRSRRWQAGASTYILFFSILVNVSHCWYTYFAQKILLPTDYRLKNKYSVENWLIAAHPAFCNSSTYDTRWIISELTESQNPGDYRHRCLLLQGHLVHRDQEAHLQLHPGSSLSCPMQAIVTENMFCGKKYVLRQCTIYHVESLPDVAVRALGVPLHEFFQRNPRNLPRVLRCPIFASQLWWPPQTARATVLERNMFRRLYFVNNDNDLHLADPLCNLILPFGISVALVPLGVGALATVGLQ